MKTNATRIALAVSTLLLLFSLQSAPVSARDLLIDVRQGPDTGQQITGPALVVFYGVNPLRFEAPQISTARKYTEPSKPTALATPRPLPIPPDVPGDILAAERGVVAARRAVDIRLAQLDKSKPIQDAINDVADAINKDQQFGDAVTAFVKLQVDQKALITISSPTTAEQNQLADMAALLSKYLVLSPPDPSKPDVSAADISADSTEPCSGLRGGSAVDTVTLTLTKLKPPTLTSTTFQIPDTPGDDTQTSNAIVNCLGSIAVSTGYLFSTLRQNSFDAIATNPALSQPHQSATPPPATVQQSNANMNLPTAYVHFAPWGCGETCGFLTFGTTITSNGSSGANSLNFVFGGSVSVYRYAFMTLGLNLGQVATPAAGYEPGQAVPAGTKIPTVNNTHVGIFLGVSFGGSPGGSTNATKSATPAPKKKKQ
jgi:hypothetical protein